MIRTIKRDQYNSMHLRMVVCGLICLFVFTTCRINLSVDESRRGVMGENGMVVTAHPAATEVGLHILRKGGSAIDAAIAIQFALAVVYPAAGNIGGGGFMIIRERHGQHHALDFRETAPAKSSESMYLDEADTVIPDLSTRGIMSCGVPGTVRGMEMAHRRFGTVPWSDLIEPAIRLAAKGFVLTEKEALSLNHQAGILLQINGAYGDFFTSPDLEPGSVVVIPDLARVLERIRDRGAADFYEGTTADLIVDEMTERGGLITMDDLRNYAAIWRVPVSGMYKGYRITSMPPPSSGGVALLQLLQMIEPFPIRKWGRYDVRTVHLMSEIEKLAYADRATHLGDSDFYPVPIEELLSSHYLQGRMQLFDMSKTRSSDDISEGHPVYESDQTTHFSIVDAEGNAAAVTTTLNGAFGSKVLVRGGGFFLNNEMDDFSIKPGHPNMFGLVGGTANKIEPNKRMLSSMTPTIIERDGRVFMALGSPGGATIITSVFQVILNVIDFKMTMQEAVDASRHHHQWKPDVIKIEEGGFSDQLVSKLEKKGHRIEEVPAIGRVDAVLMHDLTGKMEGGADYRGDDTAMGY